MSGSRPYPNPFLDSAAYPDENVAMVTAPSSIDGDGDMDLPDAAPLRKPFTGDKQNHRAPYVSEVKKCCDCEEGQPCDCDCCARDYIVPGRVLKARKIPKTDAESKTKTQHEADVKQQQQQQHEQHESGAKIPKEDHKHADGKKPETKKEPKMKKKKFGF